MKIDRGYLRDIARERERLHKHHASSRPLSNDYEVIGLIGEAVFGEQIGLVPDLSPRPSGDSGVDFTVPIKFTIDVKTARKAFNLIHEQGKPFADIYVLAEYDDVSGEAKLVGWEWGAVLRAAPVRDFGYGILNHYISREALRPMESLLGRIRGSPAERP